MTRRPQILSISFSDFRHDARVLRQLACLTEHADVTTIGYGSAPDGATEHLEIPAELPSLPQTPRGVALLALRRFPAVELHAPAVKRAMALIGDRKFDLIVANEARALPLAHWIAKGTPVWGDMHEWAPGERTQVLSWRLLVAPFMHWVCKAYLPKTDAVTTVNPSIGDLYEREYGVKPEIVRNARPLVDLRPRPVLGDRVRLVHSGGAVPGRNIETLISAMHELGDRFTLDLYLIEARGSGAYLRSLRERAATSSAIVFHEAVPPEDLPSTLNQYDVGVYLPPPVTVNSKYMLPNKLFDFIQARLAIVFGPTMEVSRIIRENGLGLVTSGFSVPDLVEVLNTLTPESVTRFKDNAHSAAERLSSTTDEAVQHGIVRRLLKA